jgi:outer membrane protein OmpA-like peptidoglycan-associated protein
MQWRHLVSSLTFLVVVIATACQSTPTRIPGPAPGAAAADASQVRNWELGAAGVEPLRAGEARAYLNLLEQNLRVLQAGRPLIVRRRPGAVIVELPASALFRPDTSELRADVLDTLDELAARLNEYARTVIDIAGYSDSLGRREVNAEFTRLRADSVAAYLYSKGVAQRRVLVAGLGEAQPLRTDDSAAARIANRRVELIISALPTR